ncbi:MAG: ABC transporter substrate-binding protein [Puniceicoccales bacterium]|nr:ABC transporter substrate-binding protein [Puniceicoccales bacterium]
MAVGQPAIGEPIRRVCVMKIMDHGAIDETARGIRDELVGSKLDIREKSAQGSTTLATQIAQEFFRQKPIAVIAIGTAAAQSMISYTRIGKDSLRIIYSAVTDPHVAGLTERVNVTGVSDFVPLEPQLRTFLRIQPKLKRLGILYNPKEANSVTTVEKLRPLCASAGIDLVERRISAVAEAPQASVQVAKIVDAIFICNDNTARFALNSILAAANARKIPVYASDTEAVSAGALAAMGPNYYEIGKQTGKMVLRIIDGESTRTIAPEGAGAVELFLNAGVARHLGITLNKQLITEAKKVFN